MKENKHLAYLSSLITLVISILLMHYLRTVYVVGLIIIFIIVIFQTPSPKEDKTGEINDANIAMLKVIGVHVLMYLAGGYISLILF